MIPGSSLPLHGCKALSVRKALCSTSVYWHAQLSIPMGALSVPRTAPLALSSAEALTTPLGGDKALRRPLPSTALWGSSWA